MRSFWVFMQVLNYLRYPILVVQILCTLWLTAQLGIAIMSGVATIFIIRLVYLITGIILNVDQELNQ